MATKDQAWLEERELSAWEPTYSAPCLHMSFEKEADGSLKPVCSWDGSSYAAQQPVAEPPQMAQSAMATNVASHALA